MFLARVIGSVVSTRKEEAMKGRKLLVLRPMLVDDEDPGRFKAGKNTIVAVDGLGAGLNDLVLFCQGSSARMAEGMKALPVDAVVIGIADAVQVEGRTLYPGARDARSAS